MRQRLTLLLTCSRRTRRRAMRRFLRPRELPSSWLPGGHDDLHLIERERQAAQILEPPAPCLQGIGVASAMRVSWVLPA
jgi:hypothetical protein